MFVGVVLSKMPGTPEEWAAFLTDKVAAQTRYAEPFEIRYKNEFILPFVRKEYDEVYGKTLVDKVLAIQPPRTGVAATVVDALAERMTVIGATDEGDGTLTAAIEKCWYANDLDVMHGEAHREALVKGRSFVIVWPGDDETPIVSVESAEQVAVHRSMVPPYNVDAAIKTIADEWTGERRAKLWLPGVMYDLTKTGSPGWKVESELKLPSKRVPVVEFQAQPRLLEEPTSIIDSIKSMVDVVDFVEALMVLAGHFGAVPIRWTTGLVVPRDPNDPSKPALGPDGKPDVGFDPRASKLWASTSTEAKFGQFLPATLEPYVTWAEHASARIRERTGIASTYLSLDLKSHMSAELLKTDEAPMVRKIDKMCAHGSFGAAWRQAMQIIAEITNPVLAKKYRVTPRWASPSTRIETQDAAVFSQLAPSLGVELCARKILGWSPDEAAAGVEEATEYKLQQAAIDSEALTSAVKPFSAGLLEPDL